MDFSKNSFVEWQLLSPCSTESECDKESYKTTIELSFRSRDLDNSGLLFYVRGNNGAEYMKLMVGVPDINNATIKNCTALY